MRSIQSIPEGKVNGRTFALAEAAVVVVEETRMMHQQVAKMLQLAAMSLGDRGVAEDVQVEEDEAGEVVEDMKMTLVEEVEGEVEVAVGEHPRATLTVVRIEKGKTGYDDQILQSPIIQLDAARVKRKS
jgi:hypothetical protein